ncbi:MAG: hypothetical protein ACERKN_07120 [Velocimicrobium sp.]
MRFQEQLEIDFATVFFNLDEFAGEHTLNGQSILLVIEEETEEDYKNTRQSLYTDGIHIQAKIIHVLKKDLDFEPFKGQILMLDEEVYQIEWIAPDDVCYQIGLGANES